MTGPLQDRSSGPVVLDVPVGEKLLGGRYRLQSEIAAGGMGRVWRGLDTRLERPVAVKVLRSELTGDATFRTRFRTEARHAGRLTHPNIAAVHDYGESADPLTGDQVAFLVMELVDGEPLSRLLERTPVLGLDRTLAVVGQTASALAAAHAAGLVHRDVKPANVLVTHDGTVKLTDFGIAWSAANAPLTSTGHVMGTPHYLSPEQVEGDRATAASDVYSLGVIAYECLAGRRPFEAPTSIETALMHTRDTPLPLPDSVPEEVRALVQRTMSRDAAARPSDGAALRAAVDALRPSRRGGAHRAQESTQALTIERSRPAGGTAVLPVAAQVPAAAPARPQEGTDAPDAGSRRLLLPALIGAVVVALAILALGVAHFSGPPVSDAAATAPASVTSAARTTGAPATVQVTGDELVGRQLADVQAQLAAAGVRVAPQQAETVDVPVGQVVSVSPIGVLPVGSTVTVYYAVAPAAAPTTQAPAPAAPVTTAAPSTPAAASSSASSSSSSAHGGHPRRHRDG